MFLTIKLCTYAKLMPNVELFGQIVCDKDGVVDWCIVLEEISLTWIEEC